MQPQCVKKASQSLLRQQQIKSKPVFCRGVYLAENTSQAANKLCAQQTAKVCRKSLQGFFDSLRLHTNMQPFKMFTKRLRESLIRAPLGTPEGTRDTKVSPRSSPGRATRPRRAAFKWFESLPQRIQKARHPNGCLAFWYAGRDSNPQPSEPESDALSIEPPAHALTAKLL